MVKLSKTTSVALETLGCKLNQAETQQLAAQLAQAGYKLVDSTQKADIYVLNTCTVTHVADRKSRHLLRLARRLNPSARLIAVGCYAHRAPQELAQIDGVDLILNNDRKNDLVSILKNTYGIKQPFTDVLLNPRVNSQRNRAFLKVQDGCHNFCAFCIVPYVRTREVSLPVTDIVAQVREKVAAGFKEVVLTGTEVGTYRSGGTNLAGLLKHILEKTDICRVRLSSLQPPEISEKLVRPWHDPRLCPHFHLSLQSGSDSVLRRMKRRYTIADYSEKVNLIRGSVTDVAITTDVIVGFPGETETEFQETFEFCRKMHFARIHVFPFSPRPGTLAATMPDQVSAAVKKERSRQMLALAKESSKNFRQGFLGKNIEVLWEQSKDGIWSGLTGNYVRVYSRVDVDLASKTIPVKLERVYNDGLWGEC